MVVNKSNSKPELTKEKLVRGFYETDPYPNLGHNLKDFSSWFRYKGDEREFLYPIKDKKIRYLEVGCGTGHLVVGVAKKFPNWDCFGIDLSDNSLNVARELSSLHKAPVQFVRGSYLEPLPFNKSFDVISAAGTIHHCDDPVKALIGLKKVLKKNGRILLHMYGTRVDRQRLEIKEMLSIMEPELKNHARRFSLYKQLIAHRKKSLVKLILTSSILDVKAFAFKQLKMLFRNLKGVSYSPPFTNNYSQISAPWVDHFCHPCESTYEAFEIGKLVNESGLKVVKMHHQARISYDLLPKEWIDEFEQLEEWDKYRMMELISGGATSFALTLSHN